MPTNFFKCQYIHETSTAQKCLFKLEFDNIYDIIRELDCKKFIATILNTVFQNFNCFGVTLY